jgi:thioesterase domain-containing protein
VQIWEEVLKVKPVGVTDDFFELGGHSFLAAVLMARIKERLGQTLSLGTLFQAPTVEKLAELLERSLEGASETSLVPLHTGGTWPPVFMIAGVGGHVFAFQKFAKLLGPNSNVYGVKAIGIDGKREPPDVMEEIAAEYVKEITALPDTGPYVLAGYSIGAQVALEVALQLRSAGRAVPTLVVFDMMAPGYPKLLPLPKRIMIHVGNFLRLRGSEKLSYATERYFNFQARVLRKLGLSILSAPTIKGVGDLSQTALKKVWAALGAAQKKYRPARKFDGQVVLFKAAEGFNWPATVADDPLYGWPQWATGGVEAHIVPGSHMELFHEGKIELVAAKLGEHLRKMEKPTGS